MDDFVPPEYLALGKAIIRVAELTQDGYADTCLSEEQAGMLQAYRERLRPERPAPAVPVPTVGYGGRSPAGFKSYEDRATGESNEDEPLPASFNVEELKALLEKEPELKERRQAAHRAAGKLLRGRLDAGTVPSVIIAKQGRRFDIEPEIWGGEEWYRALRLNQVRFVYDYDMVEGRPLILRDALEAAFNPDGAAEEESKSASEPPEEDKGGQLPKVPLHLRAEDWEKRQRDLMSGSVPEHPKVTTYRQAAEIIAEEEGLHWNYVERETRRVRADRLLKRGK